jgi:predicted  nucleic acid-binding Zn-ribbon protein
VPETSVKDKLKKLAEIQKFDSEIYDMQVVLKERPAMISALQAQFEASKKHLHELEDKLKSHVVERKGYELDLQQKEDKIAKLKAQLGEIKTNREYTAMISEIENGKADKAGAEEKILILMDQCEAAEKEIDKEKVNVAATEKVFNAKKKEVEDEIAVIKDKIRVLESKRDQLKPDVEKQQLSLYEKIVAHKEGIGIVPVINKDTCGGCYIQLMPQQINAILMGNQIVQCESCQRILYSEDGN